MVNKKINYQEKVKSRRELASIAQKLRQEGKKIGFTSGTFDILHAGHVSYLHEAKELCDVLIVGLNSNLSIKKYKDKNRPIIPEKERAFVLSALKCVNYVFIFNEINNAKNIEALKPHYYIKGGDYKTSQLSSKTLVEKYGGKVKIIPVVWNRSTTAIINKILKKNPKKISSKIKKPRKPSRAIFLDRDGVISKDIEYLHEPEKFELLPNAVDGLKKMQNLGYKLCIITTQAGIGLGYFTEEDFFRVNREMLRELSAEGIKIDKIYFCPHNITEGCNCRKPKTGLIKRAQKDLNIDLKKSFMIGDKTQDIKAGKDAGCKTILVKTGKAGKDRQFKITPDFIANDLMDAVNWIKRHGK